MKQEDHFACPKHNMRKVILIAGGGELPNQVARNFKANKILFYCISFKNNPLPKFNNLENYKIINYGKIITELNRLKNMGFKDIIMIGNLYRPKISEIKPDIKNYTELEKTSTERGCKLHVHRNLHLSLPKNSYFIHYQKIVILHFNLLKRKYTNLLYKDNFNLRGKHC